MELSEVRVRVEFPDSLRAKLLVMVLHGELFRVKFQAPRMVFFGLLP